MNDHTRPAAPRTADGAATEPNPEPGSSPAPATPRGPTIWSRIKSLLRAPASLRSDLQEALDEEPGSDASDFTESERAILQNVLKLGDTTVSDVMVPRADIQAVESSATLGKLIGEFRRAGHSRLPIYDGGLDNLLGFIHVKDALARITVPVDEPGKGAVPVKLLSPALRLKLARLDIMRDVVFVPPLMPVGDLLQQMRASHVHMAIVVDEYGGTDGLVTIEDLLEAIVGEIEDEHDEHDTALVRKVSPDTYIADARAELEEVQAVVGPDFDPGEYAQEVETLGGLVFDLIDRVPKKGEIVSHLPGFDFEILQADTRRIKRVRIKRSQGGEAALAPDLAQSLNGSAGLPNSTAAE